MTEKKLKGLLMADGMWPYFWSSQTKGLPALDSEKKPKSILIQCILSEPFRARGRVILEKSWEVIMEGLKFLPRLIDDYGTIEIILTHRKAKIAQKMYKDLAGFAWVHFHDIPVKYPIENPEILNKAYQKSNKKIKNEDDVWVINIQDVQEIGNYLNQGKFLSHRTVAVGGPGVSDPKHVHAMIGTPVKDLLKDVDLTNKIVIKGGLLKGQIADLENDAIQYNDDSILVLPATTKREFSNFVMPGFKKKSIIPCFVGNVIQKYDKHISGLLNGPERPCIACGACERICPAEIMPQILHRYVYQNAIDEVEKAGINLCVECGLCTFVCPSKVEVLEDIKQAKAQIKEESSEESGENN
jgi:Na+-transporting NADH:ubiquinone oxidoreductase subunit A